MGKTAVLAIKVLSDNRKAIKGMQETETAAGSMGRAFEKIGGLALAGAAIAGGAITALAVTGIKQAADLEQSVGAVNTVFKDSASQMHEYAEGAAEAMGLSQNSYNELATVLGTQLKNGGTSMDELADKTNGLIGLGADLASMFGGTTSDAVSALSSALKGERDPIEKYGVSLKQAQIDAKAAELGFTKVGGSLSNEANQAATLALIMEQTADAHGNFAKETDTLAGQQAILSAQWTNFTTSIGEAFLPILTSVMSVLTGSIMPALRDFGGFIAHSLKTFMDSGNGAIGSFGATLKTIGEQAIPLGRSLIDAISRVGSIVGSVFNAIQPVISAAITGIAPHLESMRAAISTMASAFMDAAHAVIDWLTPVIQNLAPVFQNIFSTIGTVVTDVFNVLSSVFNAIKALFTGDWQGLWQSVKDIFNGVWQTIKDVFTGAVNHIKALVTSFGSTISSIFSNTWTSVKNAVSNGINTVVDTIRGLPGRALSALGNIGSYLWNAGGDLIQGFIDGIKHMGGMLWDAVTGIVKNAINGLKSFLGIQSPSRLMRQFGIFTGQGFIQGLDLMRDDAADAMKDLVTMPAAPSFTATANANAMPGSFHGAVYNITINGVLDGDDAARKIQELLQRQQFRMGTVTV